MTDSADIRELAIAAWRLEKWLDNLNVERKMAAKSALRSIKKFIAASGVEVKDPLGFRFDPGLAVEVVNNEAEDAPEEELVIIETLAPYVYLNGELIQYARVIIGRTVKEARENNEIPTGPVAADAGTRETDAAPPMPEAVQDPGQAETDAPEEANDTIDINPGDMERIIAYAKIL